MADSGSPDYVPVAPGYFASRRLVRYAGAWSLWGLGVSAVITGEFSGWNLGLAMGGFGGLLVATLIISVMYMALAFSLAELASAMPFAGGAYAYARSALGPWGGFAAGLAQNVAYILAAAVVIHSMRATCIIAIVLATMALGVLATFWITAIPHFDLRFALDFDAEFGGSSWLPRGVSGVVWAMPFAIWFYLAIEQAGVAAEESKDPPRNIPRGLIWGMVTLIFAALMTLVFNSAAPPGASFLSTAEEPLRLAMNTLLHGTFDPVTLSVMAMIGQIASFHAMIYAFGRSVFATARAGYLPRTLSLAHSTRKTPHVALIAGGTIGYLAAVAIEYAPKDIPAAAILLNMSVFSAVISYVLQMLSYVILRRTYPDMPRPYRSPIGATGAATALGIAIVSLIMMFFIPAIRPGLIGVGVMFVIGLAYFALFARRRLVCSPEEEFAVNLRRTASVPAAGPAGAPVPVAGQ
ncbi:MAG: amino acid permease [Rhodospirillales bacterium]|nr:amino acid permease [Rhodospirillales bacterium]